jgi:hypothetical protein
MLASLLNCDLQRFLKNHPFIIHAFAIIAFFFLFTLIDTNNKTTLSIIFVKTFMVYLLFILMTKSKWYFVVPVLAILLVDQVIKKQIAIDQAAGKDTTQHQHKYRYWMNGVNTFIIILIILGTIHYSFLQYQEYKKNFSFYKFFFGISKCKAKTPALGKLI